MKICFRCGLKIRKNQASLNYFRKTVMQTNSIKLCSSCCIAILFGELLVNSKLGEQIYNKYKQ